MSKRSSSPLSAIGFWYMFVLCNYCPMDITFLIDPSQEALLKRLKGHIDIYYAVPTEMVKSKKAKVKK